MDEAHAMTGNLLYRAKSLLRGVTPIAQANAWLKAKQLKLGLQRLSSRYARSARRRSISYREDVAVEKFRERIRGLGRARFPVKAGDLRVFWVGANRDQDESGFLPALRRVADVVEFRNFKGGYGQWYWDEAGRVQVFKESIVALNDQCLIEQVLAANRSDGIDLLIGQLWANYISRDALGKISAMGIPVINISMDDRLPANWEMRRGTRLGAVGLAAATDMVLTTSAETCAWYACEDCAAIFWPLASDPNVFAINQSADKDIDVLFIGNRYGVRDEIVSGLVARGIQVECYGGGWPNGPSSAEQSADLFRRAKIILGIGTVGHCRDVYTLKLRDFDAPMAGALYITHRNPDLLNLYSEGKEIECYESIDEAAQKIKWYLSNPQKLKEVADAGQRKAISRDSWDARLRETFQKLGLLSM